MNILERIATIASHIKRLFQEIPAEIKKYADESIDIVEKIKEALESNTAIAVTSLIPGTWDDALREKAAHLLSQFLHVLNGATNAASYCDPDIRKRAKDGVLRDMASALTALRDNNELPANRYDTYTQIAYSKRV